MRYQRETLRHVITRALKRNTFTAPEPIEVEIKDGAVWLHGTVSDGDLIAEAVATVEATVPQMYVYSRLRVRRSSVSA
jgi:osmotically-inducible protein OsmY